MTRNNTLDRQGIANHPHPLPNIQYHKKWLYYNSNGVNDGLTVWICLYFGILEQFLELHLANIWFGAVIIST